MFTSDIYRLFIQKKKRCFYWIILGIVAQNDRIQINDTQIQVDDWRTQKFQSPIEFKHDETVYHIHFDPLEFHGHWDLGGIATIKNTGHTGKAPLIVFIKVNKHNG